MDETTKPVEGETPVQATPAEPAAPTEGTAM